MARPAMGVGRLAFGKSKGTLDGSRGWLDHDPVPHWTTATKTTEAFGPRLGQVVETEIAKQTRQAVHDYLDGSEFALSAKDGQVFQRLRVYNSDGQLITETNLFEQLLKGIAEAKQRSAEPQAQEYLAAVHNGIRLAITEIQRNSIPEPQPEPAQEVPFVESSPLDPLEKFR